MIEIGAVKTLPLGCIALIGFMGACASMESTARDTFVKDLSCPADNVTVTQEGPPSTVYTPFNVSATTMYASNAASARRGTAGRSRCA